MSDLKKRLIFFQNSKSCFAHLESDEKADDLEAVESSVNIIAHEKIVGVRTLASDLKELHEVVELAVDVAAHRHGVRHLLNVGLVNHDFACLGKGKISKNLEHFEFKGGWRKQRAFINFDDITKFIAQKLTRRNWAQGRNQRTHP